MGGRIEEAVAVGDETNDEQGATNTNGGQLCAAACSAFAGAMEVAARATRPPRAPSAMRSRKALTVQTHRRAVGVSGQPSHPESARMRRWASSSLESTIPSLPMCERPEKHLAFANRHSPPEDVHALDITGLLADNVSFFSIREDGELVGLGALKHLDEFHAELKSMHTAEAARGRGVGRAMLDHLVGVARARALPAGESRDRIDGALRPSASSVYIGRVRDLRALRQENLFTCGRRLGDSLCCGSIGASVPCALGSSSGGVEKLRP